MSNPHGWEWRVATDKHGKDYWAGKCPVLECHIFMSNYAPYTSTTFWLPGQRKVTDRYLDDERFRVEGETMAWIETQAPMALYAKCSAKPPVGFDVDHARDHPPEANHPPQQDVFGLEQRRGLQGAASDRAKPYEQPPLDTTGWRPNQRRSGTLADAVRGNTKQPARPIQEPLPLEPVEPKPQQIAQPVSGQPRLLTGTRVYPYRDALLLPVGHGCVVALSCDEFWAIGGWFVNSTEAMRWLDREASLPQEAQPA